MLRSLDDGVRSLAHYVFSAPGAHPLGLFHKTMPTMMREYGRDKLTIRRRLDDLHRIGFATWDATSGYLWVHEMAAWQYALPLPPESPAVELIRTWYSELPDNPFLGPFFDRYCFDLHLDNAAIASGSEVGRRDCPRAVTPPPGALMVQTGFELEPPPRRVLRVTDFETWWRLYPAHVQVKKRAAEIMWNRKRIPHELLPRMLATLAAQKQSAGWLKEGGQYVPRPDNYLKDERWNDVVVSGARGLNRTNDVTAQTIAQALHGDDEEV